MSAGRINWNFREDEGQWYRFLRARIAARLQSDFLFQGDRYVNMHDDLIKARNDQSFSPEQHFSEFGAFEGRHILNSEDIAKALGTVSKDYQSRSQTFIDNFEQIQRHGMDNSAIRDAIVVVLHTRANFFMKPIAESIVTSLRAVGIRAVLCNEETPYLPTVEYPIIIAPHEFFSLGVPDYLLSCEFLAKCIMYNTEQLPSPWFNDALGMFFAARAVIDINFQTAEVLRKGGIPSLYALPPFDEDFCRDFNIKPDAAHPIFSALPSSWMESKSELGKIADRDIDVFFVGNHTNRREQTLTRAAPFLANKESFIYYTRTPSSTMVVSEATSALFAGYVRLTSNTKIVLALPRYSVGYFEWERFVVQGFNNGACVVSTGSLPSPYFKPGHHYFEVSGRNLSPFLDWLLNTAEGNDAAQSVAEAGRTVCRNQLTFKRTGKSIAHFLLNLKDA